MDGYVNNIPIAFTKKLGDKNDKYVIFILFALITVFSQGPVVQSVVSLTSSLRVILLTILADSIYYILIFFAEKM